jgi:hypothetical protein
MYSLLKVIENLCERLRITSESLAIGQTLLRTGFLDVLFYDDNILPFLIKLSSYSFSRLDKSNCTVCTLRYPSL